MDEKKSEKIFRALSGVDEDLILRSEQRREKHKVPVHIWEYALSAAALLLLVGGVYTKVIAPSQINDSAVSMESAEEMESAELYKRNMATEETVAAEAATEEMYAVQTGDDKPFVDEFADTIIPKMPEEYVLLDSVAEEETRILSYEKDEKTLKITLCEPENFESFNEKSSGYTLYTLQEWDEEEPELPYAITYGSGDVMVLCFDGDIPLEEMKRLGSYLFTE